MSTPLPPNPYEALGVKKDATIPEIRSAHRKLVLKCHPDKVQDAALKAVKQDEFQKVQQAYELLSDEIRRIQYDEHVKLLELRKEMGRGNPTARSNPFEYEVRNAEPRANTYKTTRPAQPIPKAQPMPKVYTHEAPKASSYEEFARYGDERSSAPRKTPSYESTDRKRTSAKEEDRRRQDEDARIRHEKETKRSSHKEKKKSSDKEKRRGTEEKHSRTTYVEADDSDDYSHPIRRSSDKKSSRYKVVESEVRYAVPREVVREEPSPTIALPPKWNDHKDFAAQYMQASRQKAVPQPPLPPQVEEFRPHPPRRADTFAAPTSNPIQVRHVAPQYSDDDSAPRRSSARKESRRSSETPARTRERSTKDRSRRSSPTHTPVYTSRAEPVIVSPPSPPILPSRKQPAMPTQSSSPANLASYLPREKPSRSKTDSYPRNKDPSPGISRSNTYHPGDQARDRTGTGSSRLKQSHPVDSESDDSDAQPYAQRRSLSPARHRADTTTRYVVDQGRSVPIRSRHRDEMRGIGDEHVYSHDRSPSPRGARRSRERPPPTTRNQSTSRGIPVHSVPAATYYAPPEPAPIIREARPKMPPREGGHQTSRGAGAPYFGEIKYAPPLTAESVIYTATPKDLYSGRRNEPSSHARDHYHPAQRIYA